MDRGNGTPENRCQRMPRPIQQVNASIEIGQRTQPPRILKCKRSQQQENGIHNDEPDQPFTEFKRGHRKPFVFAAHPQNSGVVYGKETCQRLVRHMRAKRKAQQQPGNSKIAGPARIARRVHALHCTSDNSARITVHLGCVYRGFAGESGGASVAPLGLAMVESVSTLNFL